MALTAAEKQARYRARKARKEQELAGLVQDLTRALWQASREGRTLQVRPLPVRADDPPAALRLLIAALREQTTGPEAK
jgi:hypothetical protein